jgi:hypothetical protein
MAFGLGIPPGLIPPPGLVTNVQIPEVQIQAPGFNAFNRASVVTVGPVQIQNIGTQVGLDVEFEIKTSLKPNDPNTCDLRIWNLSEDTRRSIEQALSSTKGTAQAPETDIKVVPVRIDAGYVGHTSTVFLGEMRTGHSVISGPDIVTELNAGDADQAVILQRINQSLPASTTASQAIETVLGVMGCGLGNLKTDAIQSLLTSKPIFQRSALLKGNANDILVDICRSCGVEVSIQGGVAQFLANGRPVAGQAYLLAADTGLIGSPTVDTKGLLTCQSFIFPGIKCGGPIQINADSLALSEQGLYRIVSMTVKGSTFSDDWTIDIEARRYGVPAFTKKKGKK